LSAWIDVAATVFVLVVMVAVGAMILATT